MTDAGADELAAVLLGRALTRALARPLPLALPPPRTLTRCSGALDPSPHPPPSPSPHPEQVLGGTAITDLRLESNGIGQVTPPS